jgi:hypothetical protein
LGVLVWRRRRQNEAVGGAVVSIFTLTDWAIFQLPAASQERQRGA